MMTIKQIQILLWMLFSVLILSLLSCYKGHGLSETQPMGVIKGRIQYVGEWPDSTKEVHLAVLSGYPEGITDAGALMTFVIQNQAVFSDTLTRFVNFYDFELSCPPGRHAWVVIAWFPNIENYLFGVKELGAYYGNNTLEQGPVSIDVAAGQTTSGIDIIADFKNVYREEPYF